MKETKLIKAIHDFIRLCDQLLQAGFITDKQHWSLTKGRKEFLESFQ